MLARMLEQQVAVTAVMFEGSKSLKDLSLYAKQVSVMEEVVALLSPLKEITAMMSSQSSVTVSIIAPTLNKIERFFQTNESDSKFVKDSKSAILNDLGKRYKGESQSLINMAALLDPRFRALPFLTSDQRDQIHTDMLSTLELSIIAEGNPSVKQEIEIRTPQVPSQSETLQVKHEPNGQVKQEDGTVVPPAKRLKTEELASTSFFDDIIITQVDNSRVLTPVEIARKELDRYLAEPLFPPNMSDTEKRASMAQFNPLSWWKAHGYCVPNLALLAKRILCVPATSTPSERVFTVAGNLITKQRAMLSPENADRMIFLNMNYKQYKQY